MMETQIKLIDTSDVTFNKEINMDTVRYFLENKMIGTYDKKRDIYYTFRRRYTIPLPGKKYANIGRFPKGHFFHIFNGYGISDYALKNRRNEDLLVIVEKLQDENKLRFWSVDFETFMNKSIRHIDNSNGIVDHQRILNIDFFKLCGEGTLERFKLEVK